jgi:hypothetical protein
MRDLHHLLGKLPHSPLSHRVRGMQKQLERIDIQGRGNVVEDVAIVALLTCDQIRDLGLGIVGTADYLGLAGVRGREPFLQLPVEHDQIVRNPPISGVPPNPNRAY